FQEYIVYNSDLFFAGFAALSITAIALLYTVYSRRISVWSLAAGAMLWWVLGMLLLAVQIPGAAYALTWPLAASTLALGAVFCMGPPSNAGFLLAVLLAEPAVPLPILGPWLYLCSVAVTIVPAPVWMGLTTLLIGLMLPLLTIMARPN